MLKKTLLFLWFSLLLASTTAVAKERSCSAYISAVVSTGERIMLADITAKGQDLVATKARVEARDRAFQCFFRLIDYRFDHLGLKETRHGPQHCRTSNITGFANSEVDIETKVRIAACTTYRDRVEAGLFRVTYEITTFGGPGCGNKNNKYALTSAELNSPIWPSNFCRTHGFDYFLPY